MGRRVIVTCGVLFACICAPADAQIVFSADGRLYEITADGSDRGLFTTPTGVEASDSDPEWSPDGTQLAVVHQRDPDGVMDWSRIDLLSADGSVRQPLMTLERYVYAASPHWSPDGDQLAFTRFTEHQDGFTSEIVLHDLDGEERTVATQRLGRRLTSVSQPEWSANGESILYTRYRIDRDFNFRPSIYTVPVDGGPAQLIKRDASFPAVSPDGSRIAFISITDRNGQTCGSDECSYNGELYVMDPDGTDAQRLTHSEGDDMAPDWSADGSRIAFNSNRNFPDGYAHEIYSIEPDGDCLTWLTNGTANSASPTWRPEAVATDPGGCGATPRPPLIEVDLAPARTFGTPRPLWLGLTHRGLLLSEVDSNPLWFGYLDCGRFKPAECPPGIQLTVFPVCSREAWVRDIGFFLGPELIYRRRHALVDDSGPLGLMAVTGGVEVHVLPEVSRAGPARAAFRRLRAFPRERPVDHLRPPVIPSELARQIERVVRLHQRLGSVRAVAERLNIGRGTVHKRLANAEAFDLFGHRVRTKRC